ncbi:hypothetical protein AB6A40_003052 [Gnathostoma spinigerum]|uniref:TM2 domain-containing protein n=1 Tax=Gnathostoma spinigerum TaxID=75299 RepID=A0ABD6E8D8_9BILA
MGQLGLVNIFLSVLSVPVYKSRGSENLVSCSNLLLGQYRCDEPLISIATQLPETCDRDNSIRVSCEVAPGINCIGLNNVTNRFEKRIENGCAYSSGYSHSTALLLSVFLGWTGADRFYLGYYAIGGLKLFTFGCFFLCHLTDSILIALQLLGPADGTAYRVNYYGLRSIRIHFTNETYVSELSCFDCGSL